MIFETKTWRGGLSDWDDKGIAGAIKFGSGLDIRKRVDSLSAGQDLTDEGLITAHSASPSKSPSASQSFSPSASLSNSASKSPSSSPSAGGSGSGSQSPSRSASPSGSLSPSHSPSVSPSPSAGLTTVFRDLVHTFVKATDGNTYGFGNTGYIYKRDSEANWSVVAKDVNGAIRGAEEKPSSSNKTYLYWASNRVLRRKELPGRSDWNDIEDITESLTPAPHTMKQIGGALYICNKSMIAYVGYDDSFSPEVLDLIPGNTANTIVERNGMPIIGTDKINGAIDAEVPLAQVGTEGDIYFANMTDALPVTSFPGGGQINPGGVALQVEQVNFYQWDGDAVSYIDKQNVGNMALFGVYGGDEGKNGIYSYGRKKKNHPFVLNLDYALEADEIGAVTYVDGKVLASYLDGTSFGVKSTDNDHKATAVCESLDFRAPAKTPASITKWEYAELFMKPLPIQCSVSYYYRVNKDGDFVQAYLADGNVDYTTTGGRKAVFLVQAEGEIYEDKVILHPYGNTTAEVHRKRVYFT